MPRGTISRRGFLSGSITALTIGAGLPDWFARELLAADLDREADGRKVFGPNDKIQIGAIGTGSRGVAVMNEANRRPGVEFVAVCDVDAAHRREAAEKSKVPGIAEIADYRELLANPKIDAVTVVTPDHWHTLIAVAAIRAGKDVYCEKPMTLTIDEGKVFTRVANASDRIVQVGTQQRSDARFRLACELVRNGRIGKVTRVETRIGENPEHKPFVPSPVPPGLDWNAWLGQTPEVPFIKERCHYEFRWWYEYSGGKVTDWGAHHNDIAQWGLGRDDTGPVAIEATSSPVGTDPNAYNCPVDFTIKYTYADGVELLCTAKGDNGVKFIGEAGWIFVDRSKIEASDPKLLTEPLAANATRLYASDDHMANFIDSVRSRKPPICDANIGHRSVSVCHLGNIAIRTGEKLRWDPKAERFDGSDKANAMLSRPMRSPWVLEG